MENNKDETLYSAEDIAWSAHALIAALSASLDPQTRARFEENLRYWLDMREVDRIKSLEKTREFTKIAFDHIFSKQGQEEEVSQ